MISLRTLFMVALVALTSPAALAADNVLQADEITPDKISDKELLYFSDKFETRSTKLARAQLLHDAAVLIAAFERAYSGHDYLPAGVYDKLVSQVKTLAETMPLAKTKSDGNLFCTKLANIFWDVPDNHLYTSRACRSEIKKPKPSNVGTNIHPKEEWKLEIRNVGEKRIGVLSLGVMMPDKKNSSWNGFKEAVKNLREDTDALIIDLRGNKGGMSDNIRWLASALYGAPAKIVDETIYIRNSAAASALRHNDQQFEILYATEDKLPIQKYLIEEKEKWLKDFKKLENKQPGWKKMIRKGSSAKFNGKKGYDKPLRILIDNSCASACESGFVRFLSHPQLKSYGANTNGCTHYGDASPLVLPESKTMVSMAVTFREYADGRFTEKVGHAPDVRVPDGEDALAVVLKTFEE